MAISSGIYQINRDVLRRMNRQISLRATKFANTFLSGIFRAIFRIEKASEFTDLEVFQLDDDPSRIMWSRLNTYQLSNMAKAMANEEVVARRYQLFTEYDFVLVADVSRSMLVNCWNLYGGKSYVDNIEDMRESLEYYRKTKMYILKYTIASFLHAARSNKFTSWVSLFGGNKIMEFNSNDDYNLEEVILPRIDEHFERLVESEQTEEPMMAKALQQLSKRKRRCIILCISDFIDCVEFSTEKKMFVKKKMIQTPSRLSFQDILIPFGELAYQHRILTLVLNDWAELTKHETLEAYSQESVLQDVESKPFNRKITITDEIAKGISNNVITSRDKLRERFQLLGVMYEDLVAGRDDNELDRKIYRLGIVTGD